jgi:hypothetical protein
VRGDRHRLLILGVLVGMAALVAAGFPAQDVSPEEYAESVCGGTGEWFEEIVDLATEFQDDRSAASDADEQQDLTLDFLDAAIDATTSWREEIEDAGTPDVDGGKSTAKAYRKGARESAKVLKKAAGEVEDLPTRDDDEFAEQLDEILTSIDESLSEAGDAVSDAEQDADDEYRDALEDEPACEELREAVGDVE